ncbi:MAG: hypothetical protein IJ011_10550 [Clostridia bacterium]|nr:hypothetical protein [Clostridia bacterium]MBQ8850761.1 hypothetical protein [Clostridia bacterium]
MNSKSKKLKAYILIVISIVFIIIAIFLVTSNTFWYNLQNIDYYAAKYEYTQSMSSGYFGSSYRYIASQWKELYNEALTCVIGHVTGAIILLVGGSIGLYDGIKKLKKLKMLNDENN